MQKPAYMKHIKTCLYFVSADITPPECLLCASHSSKYFTFINSLNLLGGGCFPVVQLVKNLSAMQETWVGKMPWRRERLPTPVFWPGEFHELYSPWSHKESDMTERLSLSMKPWCLG